MIRGICLTLCTLLIILCNCSKSSNQEKTTAMNLSSPSSTLSREFNGSPGSLNYSDLILSSIANVEKDSNACDSNFRDSDNLSCEDYRITEWCTSSGEYGTNWDHSKWGYFSDKADKNGNTALVCPECGCVEPNKDEEEEDLNIFNSFAESHHACDSNFRDSDNLSCEDYRVTKWCTSSGEYGTNWDHSKWGKFSNKADKNGNTARVCPECGCVEPNKEKEGEGEGLSILNLFAENEKENLIFDNSRAKILSSIANVEEDSNERHESYTSLYYSESDSSVSKISEKENLEGETKNEDLNLEKDLKRYDLSILSSLAEDQYYKDGLQSEMMDKLPNFKKNNLEDNN